MTVKLDILSIGCSAKFAVAVIHQAALYLNNIAGIDLTHSAELHVDFGVK